MLGSFREFRQIAHVSAQMSHDHMATAFHFLISKRGGGGGAFPFFLGWDWDTYKRGKSDRPLAAATKDKGAAHTGGRPMRDGKLTAGSASFALGFSAAASDISTSLAGSLMTTACCSSAIFFV
uniref:Uncharacterized protein n=1 Tax=Odontella aurita TaxID=265563 RepID=A0A7S4MYK5_9STRA